MPRHIPRLGLSLLLASALVAACQGTKPTAPAPSGTKGPTPGAKTSQAPLPKAAPVRLRPLPRGAASLAGQIKLDPAYAVATAGARVVGGIVVPARGQLIGNDGSTLISNDGSTIVAAGGLNLIGNDGSTLIGNDGSTMVAAGGGNLVVPASELGEPGRSVLGSDGAPLMNAGNNGTLIGNDGSTMVAAGGGNLIGNDGSTMVAAGGGNYRLAQAAGPLPAAGMWVSVVDTRDGATVPLGIDDHELPVYAVYSDAQGRFSVQIPAAVAPFVRVVARAPKTRDPRLVLDVLAKRGATDVAVDEEAAAVTGYVRRLLATRLLGYLGYGREQADPGDPVGVAIVGGFPELTAALRQMKDAGMPPAAFEEIGLLLADAALADLDLAAFTLNPVVWTDRDPDGAKILGNPLIPELKDLFRRASQGVARAAQGQDLAAWADAQPWLIAANLRRPGEPRLRILRPADIFPFVANTYLASPSKVQNYKGFDVMTAIGLVPRDQDRLGYAAGPVLAALIDLAGRPADTGKPLAGRMAELAGKLAAARTQAPLPAGSAAPLPTPPPACSWTVATLAGTDGLTTPNGLALDESGAVPVLYVADYAAAALKKITLAPAGPAIATVAATGLDGPSGLVLDGKGAAYVAELGRHAIQKVDLATGAVTAIAGGGPGFADDVPGADARFRFPSGLLIDAGGDLLVADNQNGRIRRVAIGDPAHRVTTVVGSGRAERVEGPFLATDGHPGMALDTPAALARDAQGRLWVTESAAGAVVRSEAAFGPGGAMRLVAGFGTSAPVAPDGLYHDARLDVPYGAAFLPDGRLVVADHWGNTIRLVTPEGWVTTIAGNGAAHAMEAAPDLVDGPGATARFANPFGVAVAKDGTVYVADTRNHKIRTLRQVP